MSRNDLPNEKAPNFNARLRETIMTYLGKTGDVMDRGVTLRDLVDSNLVEVTSLRAAALGGAVPMAPGAALVAYKEDLTPPPTPTGFTATAGVSSIMFETDPAVFTQGNGYFRTRIYGVLRNPNDPLPTFAAATDLTQFSGVVGAFSTDPAVLWHVWAKWETKDGVVSASPAGGVNGLVVETGQDVTRLLSALTSELDSNGNPVNTGKMLIERVAPTTINGVLVPAGVYMWDAYIQNGTITNAKIANAAIDNAKIANLDAAKITTGYIDANRVQAGSLDAKIANLDAAVISSGYISNARIQDGTITNAKIGNVIQSSNFSSGSAGWQLDKATGSIEANNGTFRGTLAVKSSSSGARMEITNSVIKVYDAGGTLRVKIGDLAA